LRPGAAAAIVGDGGDAPLPVLFQEAEALPDSFMSDQSLVLGGGTERLEEVSEQDYLAAVADLRAG
jgi:hypothetical protein